MDRLVPDVAEQVIDVPKIAPQDGNVQRASLRAPQLVEQLVEVPTVPLFVEHNVDIPVPGGCGSFGCGGLQGFLPEQSSLQPSVEQNAGIPVLGGGLQIFLPVSTASSSALLEEPFQEGFRTFPRSQKVRRPPGR